MQDWTCTIPVHHKIDRRPDVLSTCSIGTRPVPVGRRRKMMKNTRVGERSGGGCVRGTAECEERGGQSWSALKGTWMYRIHTPKSFTPTASRPEAASMHCMSFSSPSFIPTLQDWPTLHPIKVALAIRLDYKCTLGVLRNGFRTWLHSTYMEDI
jgi:hypothetical protein